MNSHRTLGLVFLSLAFVMPVVPSCLGQEGLQGYDHLITRSRQQRGWTNHGTEVYLAPEIDGRSGPYTDEELGNYIVEGGSRLRKIHVSPRVRNDMDCQDEKLRIGVVEVEDRAVVNKVEINVDVDGDITGSDVFIGGVRLKRGGRIKKARIRTQIKGDVDAK